MSPARVWPDRERFVELADAHPVVPVCREVLGDLHTPLGVYARLREPGEAGSFLLESVEQGERWGRYSFVGRRPLLTLTARWSPHGCEAGLEAAEEGLPVARARELAGDGRPLEALAELCQRLRTPEVDGLPPLHAGLVGWIGWEAVREVEPVLADDPLPDDPDLGDVDHLRLSLPGELVAVDHLRQRLVVVTNVVAGPDAGRQWDAAVARSDRLVERLGAAVPTPAAEPPEPVDAAAERSTMAPEAYERVVAECLEHIRAGEVFQVVPSQRFSVGTDADALSIYRVLRLLNPSPYMFLLEGGDLGVVGSSPEALVTLRDGRASIWPIAGTRRRGEDDEADRALERELLADAKERAEHVMLVDLARNDLGRVCEVGSVEVDELMGVQRFSHVMHLVSTVTGTARPGASAVDVLRATFPAGTLSGAPKVRAMQLLHRLEPVPRGIYGGGIGYLDLAGNMDLCIAIRTLVLRDGVAHVQAGAGVVADSDPAAEREETERKAGGLLAAVRAAERAERGQGGAPAAAKVPR